MYTEGKLQDRIVAWLKDHPGPQHRSVIAEAVGTKMNHLSTSLVKAKERGLIHSEQRGFYAWGPGATAEVMPTNGDGANGHQVLPESLNFHVVGLLSDNRLVLEFKKTKDVFVAKRVDV